jgi:hypothetical protein
MFARTLEPIMLLAGIGANRNRRNMPCSRHVTICALNPQKVPITDIAITGPSKYRTLSISPFANTLPYKKKNAIGITRLKNRNALFRSVIRMRIAASVRIVFNPAASVRSIQ